MVCGFFQHFDIICCRRSGFANYGYPRTETATLVRLVSLVSLIFRHSQISGLKPSGRVAPRSGKTPHLIESCWPPSLSCVVLMLFDLSFCVCICLHLSIVVFLLKFHCLHVSPFPCMTLVYPRSHPDRPKPRRAGWNSTTENRQKRQSIQEAFEPQAYKPHRAWNLRAWGQKVNACARTNLAR